MEERGDCWGLIATACGRFRRLKRSGKWVLGNPFLRAMVLRRYRPRGAPFRLHRPPLAGAVYGARILDVLPYLTSCEWFSVGSGRPGSSRSEKPHVKVIQKRMSWICCGIIVHSTANMATTLSAVSDHAHSLSTEGRRAVSQLNVVSLSPVSLTARLSFLSRCYVPFRAGTRMPGMQ